MEWISVKDEMPPARTKVIAFYRNSHGNGRTVMAQYVPPLTVLCCDFYDDDAEYEADFVDGDDEGFVKESWHEIIDNWPDYSGCEIVHGEVTHWMPKPLPPTAANDEISGPGTLDRLVQQPTGGHCEY